MELHLQKDKKEKNKAKVRIKLLQMVLQSVSGSAVYKKQCLNQIHRDKDIYTCTYKYKYTYMKISPMAPEWVISCFARTTTFSVVGGKHFNKREQGSSKQCPEC